MKKPFSPEGLQQLLQSLYQLPDLNLQIEAAALAANLRLWLDNNFILTPEQISYLLAVDNRQIANTAAAGQHFIANRLPINLVKAVKPIASTADNEGKYFELKKEMNSSYNPIEGYREEALLTVNIFYQ